MSLPYRALAPYLIERFGRRVHRVTLDAGSNCPNRDGTKGRGGCFYCDVDGSGSGFLRSGIEIAAQMRRGLAWFRRQYPQAKAIAYFQSYSNTYGSMDRLREVLRAIEPYEQDIAALSVATRPDTFSEEAAAILASYRSRFPVWVELGLETAEDETLRAINRLHTLAEFEEAGARVHRHGLELIVHAILGLPGEGPEHFRATAAAIARAKAQGVKIHQLMVLQKTVFAKWHAEGKLKTMDWPEYLGHVADFIQALPHEIVVHRVQGDARPGELIAPIWEISKNQFRDRLAQELLRRRQSKAVTTPCAGQS